MAGVTDAQLKAAEARGRKMLETEPRATAAHYDPATDRVVVDLLNGCTYAFPAQLVQDLRGASHAGLSRIEVDGMGFNLHWPALDVDLYVPALVSGISGVRHFRNAGVDGARACRYCRTGEVAGEGRRVAGEWREGRAAAQDGARLIGTAGSRGRGRAPAREAECSVSG